MKRTLSRSRAVLPEWALAPASTGRQERAVEAKPLPALEVTGEPMPWRRKLARWSDDLRERWGVLANALEDQGFPWRPAEQQAFDQVQRETQTERSDHGDRD
jgi:hypothetical protein